MGGTPKNDDVERGKKFQVLLQLRQVWLDNAMAEENALLVLSSGGIGLLAVWLKPGSLIEVAVEWLSLLGFLVTLIASLRNYKLNRELLMALMSANDGDEATKRLQRHEDRLKRWDLVRNMGFLLGVGALSLLAVGRTLSTS